MQHFALFRILRLAKLQRKLDDIYANKVIYDDTFYGTYDGTHFDCAPMDSDGEMTSLSSSPSFSSPSSSSSSSPPCPFSFGSSSPSSPFAEAVFDGGLEVFFEEAREEARGEAAAEAGVWEKIKKTITSMFLYGSTVVPHRRYIW